MAVSENILQRLEGSHAPIFSASETYEKYDVVTHEGKLYYANDDIAVGAWSDSDWTECDESYYHNIAGLKYVQNYNDEHISGETNLVNFMVENHVAPWDETKTYTKGSVVSHDGKVYECHADTATVGTFDVDPVPTTVWKLENYQRTYTATSQYPMAVSSSGNAVIWSASEYYSFSSAGYYVNPGIHYVAHTTGTIGGETVDIEIDGIIGEPELIGGSYYQKVPSTDGEWVFLLYKLNTSLTGGRAGYVYMRKADDTNIDAECILTTSFGTIVEGAPEWIPAQSFEHLFNEYNVYDTYAKGDLVAYNGNLYTCLNATSGAFDSTKWHLTLYPELVYNEIYNDWTPNTSYSVGDIVHKPGSSGCFYKCKAAHTSGTSFSSTNWDGLLSSQDTDLGARLIEADSSLMRSDDIANDDDRFKVPNLSVRVPIPAGERFIHRGIVYKTTKPIQARDTFPIAAEPTTKIDFTKTESELSSEGIIRDLRSSTNIYDVKYASKAPVAPFLAQNQIRNDASGTSGIWHSYFGGERFMLGNKPVMVVSPTGVYSSGDYVAEDDTTEYKDVKHIDLGSITTANGTIMNISTGVSPFGNITPTYNENAIFATATNNNKGNNQTIDAFPPYGANIIHNLQNDETYDSMVDATDRWESIPYMTVLDCDTKHSWGRNIVGSDHYTPKYEVGQYIRYNRRIYVVTKEVPSVGGDGTNPFGGLTNLQPMDIFSYYADNGYTNYDSSAVNKNKDFGLAFKSVFIDSGVLKAPFRNAGAGEMPIGSFKATLSGAVTNNRKGEAAFYNPSKDYVAGNLVWNLAYDQVDPDDLDDYNFALTFIGKEISPNAEPATLKEAFHKTSIADYMKAITNAFSLQLNKKTLWSWDEDNSVPYLQLGPTLSRDYITFTQPVYDSESLVADGSTMNYATIGMPYLISMKPHQVITINNSNTSTFKVSYAVIDIMSSNKPSNYYLAHVNDDYYILPDTLTTRSYLGRCSTVTTSTASSDATIKYYTTYESSYNTYIAIVVTNADGTAFTGTDAEKIAIQNAISYTVADDVDYMPGNYMA